MKDYESNLRIQAEILGVLPSCKGMMCCMVDSKVLKTRAKVGQQEFTGTTISSGI